MNDIESDPKPTRKWATAIGIFISGLALVAYFTQAYYMRQAMRVDQRAWISIPVPNVFPLDGKTIPVNLQITDSGKTPGRITETKFVATVLEKGEKPHIGDFALGHTYNKLYVGAVFPQSPIPFTFELKKYRDKSQETIAVDDRLRQDVAEGKRYIILFGRIDYTDTFGIPHWYQFCNGSGSGIDPDSVHDCIFYNDFDDNVE